MNILIVNTRHFFGGGDSTYTFNLADVLRQRGHEVAFFAMQDERNIFDQNSDLFVSNIDFRRENKRKNLISGFCVMHRAIYSTEARKKFRQLLKRFHPDIIHIQNIHAHITPSVILEAKKRDLPVVWTLHDYKLVCPNSHYLIDKTGEICEACGRKSYYQAIFKRCKKDSIFASVAASLEAYVHRIMNLREKVDFFLAPSAFLRRKMIEQGFLHDRVKHVPYVLPNNIFKEGYCNKNYLLFLGRIEPIKGIFPLLNACKQIPEVNLVIAGRVSESLAYKLHKLLPSNAKFVGMLHRDKLKRFLFDSTAVVVPSVWYENQPFSILEAFAASKPVIASDLGGMPELVKNSSGGLLVPPGDVQALAKAMKWMTTHARIAQEMGHSAYKYVCREHSTQKHYERLMQIYENVM